MIIQLGDMDAILKAALKTLRIKSGKRIPQSFHEISIASYHEVSVNFLRGEGNFFCFGLFKRSAYGQGKRTQNKKLPRKP